jgi:hypothetical protein
MDVRLSASCPTAGFEIDRCIKTSSLVYVLFVGGGGALSNDIP